MLSRQLNVIYSRMACLRDSGGVITLSSRDAKDVLSDLSAAKEFARELEAAAPSAARAAAKRRPTNDLRAWQALGVSHKQTGTA